MGMSLYAYLFYGRPAKNDENHDDLPGQIEGAKIPGIDWITFGRDFAGTALVVKDSVREAYYGALRLGAETPGVLPAVESGWDGLMVEAMTRLGFADGDFEPVGWYLAPSYA